MMRALLLLVAAGCFVGSLVCVYLASPVPSPDLWTERPVIDLGELSQGQEVRAEFQLVNRFPQALDISDVVKGCACSEVTLSEKHLEPNGRTALRIVWKTGRDRGRSGVNLQVVFKLAEGSLSYKLFRVEADVVPDIRYEPPKITFTGDGRETHTVKFSAGQMSQFTIAKAFCDRPGFTAVVCDQHCVQVTLDPEKLGAEAGSDARLVVETDSANEPQMFIGLTVAKMKTTR